MDFTSESFAEFISNLHLVESIKISIFPEIPLMRLVFQTPHSANKNTFFFIFSSLHRWIITYFGFRAVKGTNQLVNFQTDQTSISEDCLLSPCNSQRRLVSSGMARVYDGVVEVSLEFPACRSLPLFSPFFRHIRFSEFR